MESDAIFLIRKNDGQITEKLILRSLLNSSDKIEQWEKEL